MIYSKKAKLTFSLLKRKSKQKEKNIRSAAWYKLLDYIKTPNSASKCTYQFGASPLLGGGLGWGLIFL